jgi:orotidine-5'-phosphate decarboxylase
LDDTVYLLHMIELGNNLPAEQRCVMAIDTSETARAAELAGIAQAAGTAVIKAGLELGMSPDAGWPFCSENAAEHGLDWIADAKIHDIPNTARAAVRELARLEHPPTGITIHAHSGVSSMEAAQEEAVKTGITLFGVTELTSISEEDLRTTYDSVLEALGVKFMTANIELRKILVKAMALDVARAGLAGLVASAKELGDPIQFDARLRNKVTLIPGTRSKGADANDQKNVLTPGDAILAGASLLVIGRQVTDAADPVGALRLVVDEVQEGIVRKDARDWRIRG